MQWAPGEGALRCVVVERVQSAAAQAQVSQVGMWSAQSTAPPPPATAPHPVVACSRGHQARSCSPCVSAARVCLCRFSIISSFCLCGFLKPGNVIVGNIHKNVNIHETI